MGFNYMTLFNITLSVSVWLHGGRTLAYQT